MKTYLMWFNNEGKQCAIMEVTKIISDAERLAPHIPRVMIVTALTSYLNADEILTAETEEEMMYLFENASVVYVGGGKKEDLN